MMMIMTMMMVVMVVVVVVVVVVVALMMLVLTTAALHYRPRALRVSRAAALIFASSRSTRSFISASSLSRCAIFSLISVLLVIP